MPCPVCSLRPRGGARRWSDRDRSAPGWTASRARRAAPPNRSRSPAESRPAATRTPARTPWGATTRRTPPTPERRAARQGQCRAQRDAWSAQTLSIGGAHWCETSAMPVITAAGVIVRSKDQVLVVHRPKYDDWSFPKGKLDRGEHITACAVREVREETGLDVRLGLPLVDQHYRVRPVVKRSEEHTSELQSLMRISSAVFCLKKKKAH